MMCDVIKIHYGNITPFFAIELTADNTLLGSLILIMPPFEKGGAYCFAHVGSVGIP